MNERAGITEGMVEDTAAMFDALGHPMRLRLVAYLVTHRDASPTQLSQHFGVSQQNASKHLKTLLQAGVLNRRKDGSSTLYSLRDVATARLVVDGEGIARRRLAELSAQARLTPEVARGVDAG